jgi:serine/threonine protein kinase/Tfp pilus assembly protein PilF
LSDKIPPKTSPDPSDDDFTLSSADVTKGADQPHSESAGDRPAQPESIAGFRILGRLGDGGMGVVWEAEQDRPKRRVALKVMRRDHIVDELHLRMFHREAESLARLRHPNIAAIFESGHSDDGHDYFAMELVRGTTLDVWLEGRPKVVDAEELRLRLDVFRTLCDAVHYAHLRGVIHRDLKPSNIMVVDDASSSAGSSGSHLPTVKILDFGLARITDTDVPVTEISQIGAIKGTLQYMSPEQARGDAGAIDVRTDVYALGVILYEMLTGHRPYDVNRAALAAAVQVICEEPPKPMSGSWSGTRRLDQDVETIVGKSLEKDADRRYDSAAALADDVQRYLDSRPIVAHPPSAAYRARKFAQRNRAIVVTVGSVIVALLLGLITTAWGFRTARAEAERSRQVATFLQEMLAGVGPSVAQGADTTLLESILEQTASRVESELSGQPRVAAALHQTIGETHSEIGQYDEADKHLTQALEMKRSVYGAASPETLSATVIVGILRNRQGRIADAEELYRRALDGYAAAGMEGSMEASDALHNLGILLYENGRLDEAVPLLEECLALRRAEVGERTVPTFVTATALALARIKQTRTDEAEELLSAVLEGRREVLGETHPHTIESVYNLAGLYGELSRFEDAERLYLDALDRMDSVHGPDHPKTIKVRNQIGVFYRSLGRLDEAEGFIARSLDDARNLLGDEDPLTLRVRQNFGLLRYNQQRFEDAEAIIREVVETSRRVLGPDHPATLDTTMSLLQILNGLRRADDASILAAELVDASRQRWGDDHPRTLLHLNEAGHVWAAAGEYERSAAAYQEALEGRRRLLGPTHPHTLVSLNSYAVLLMRQDDYAAARPLVQQAYDAQLEVLGPDHVDTVISLFNLAHAAKNLDEPEEAVRLFNDCIDRWGRTLGDLHPYTIRARTGLADVLIAVERWQDTEDALLETAEQLLADPQVPGRVSQPVVERLVTCYEGWGRSNDAARWRARLPAT